MRDMVLPGYLLWPLVVALGLALAWVAVRACQLALSFRDKPHKDRVPLGAIRRHEARKGIAPPWPPDGEQFYIPRRR